LRDVVFRKFSSFRFFIMLEPSWILNQAAREGFDASHRRRRERRDAHNDESTSNVEDQQPDAADSLSLYEEAVCKKWVVCVPQPLSLRGVDVSASRCQFAASHVLRPCDRADSNDSCSVAFLTLNDRFVRLVDDVLMVHLDRRNSSKVFASSPVLREETHYDDQYRPLCVIYLENPIHEQQGQEASSSSLASNSVDVPGQRRAGVNVPAASTVLDVTNVAQSFGGADAKPRAARRLAGSSNLSASLSSSVRSLFRRGSDPEQRRNRAARPASASANSVTSARHADAIGEKTRSDGSIDASRRHLRPLSAGGGGGAARSRSPVRSLFGLAGKRGAASQPSLKQSSPAAAAAAAAADRQWIKVPLKMGSYDEASQFLHTHPANQSTLRRVDNWLHSFSATLRTVLKSADMSDKVVAQVRTRLAAVVTGTVRLLFKVNALYARSQTFDRNFHADLTQSIENYVLATVSQPILGIFCRLHRARDDELASTLCVLHQQPFFEELGLLDDFVGVQDEPRPSYSFQQIMHIEALLKRELDDAVCEMRIISLCLTPMQKLIRLRNVADLVSDAIVRIRRQLPQVLAERIASSSAVSILLSPVDAQLSDNNDDGHVLDSEQRRSSSASASDSESTDFLTAGGSLSPRANAELKSPKPQSPPIDHAATLSGGQHHALCFASEHGSQSDDDDDDDDDESSEGKVLVVGALGRMLRKIAESPARDDDSGSESDSSEPSSASGYSSDSLSRTAPPLVGSMAEQAAQEPVTTDELLSYLIAVIVWANPPNLVSTLAFLDMHVADLFMYSELGFLLTTFHACVTFLQEQQQDLRVGRRLTVSAAMPMSPPPRPRSAGSNPPPPPPPSSTANSMLCVAGTADDVAAAFSTSFSSFQTFMPKQPPQLGESTTTVAASPVRALSSAVVANVRLEQSLRNEAPPRVFLWGCVPDVAPTPLLVRCFEGKGATLAVCAEKATAVVTTSGRLFIYDIFGAHAPKAASGESHATPTEQRDMQALEAGVASRASYRGAPRRRRRGGGANKADASSDGDDDDERGAGRHAHVFRRVRALHGVRIDSVAGGGSHMMALAKDGRLFVWGDNEFGQLGLGDTTSHQAPQHNTLIAHMLAHAVRRSASGSSLVSLADADGGDDDDDERPHVPVIRQIACGGAHSVCLTDNGVVWAWGRGALGRLGMGEDDNHNRATPQPVAGALRRQVVVQVACGWRHTMALTDVGQLYAFGANADGQLGVGDERVQCAMAPRLVDAFSGRFVKHIDAGFCHSAALVDDSLYTWGWGEKGQLGHGGDDAKRQFAPRRVPLPDSVRPSQVSCGGFHTAAIVETGHAYAWGSNRFGQLGLADTVDRLSPQLVASLGDIHVTHIACGFWQTIAIGQNCL
jgi:alpha-tubulin suppressor-like RCC1 family protein